MHSPLISAVYSQGREPIRHSQATSNSHQWPICTCHLICPHFHLPSIPTTPCHPSCVIYPGHAARPLPLFFRSFFGSGWNQTNLSQHWEWKNAIWSWDPPQSRKLMWKYFGTILFTEQMLIYLRYIFSMYISVCLWWWYWNDHILYLHLKERWIKWLEKILQCIYAVDFCGQNDC